MPKYKKGKKQTEQYQEEVERVSDLKSKMFSSSMISILIGGVLLVVSLILNNNLIPISTVSGSALDIVVIFIKSLVIILFYAFVLIGLANNKELKGKPISYKEIIILAALALIQSVRSGYVFGISLAGILIVTFYLWVVQAKVQSS